VGTILLGDTVGQEEIQRTIKTQKDTSSLKNNLAIGQFDISWLK
jgi:NAD(P)H-nitrite reductase large subunit